MIIRNEKAKGAWFRYKVAGLPTKVWIAGYTSKTINELTTTDQILWKNVENRIHKNQVLESKFYDTQKSIGGHNSVYVSSAGTTGHYDSLQFSIVPTDK